ncbi:mediator of RNA polymerase II transcription subunit 13 [Chytriomyces hyalinus]|nr:mediator of RNA polymerase II transcription subunit 13 [Chytriomyces hyalinus]
MSAPVISPLHASNTGSDLDLAMLGAGNSGNSNNNSKELMDLELGQIGDDDFDDFFGGGPSTTVKSTSVTGSIGAGTPAASGANSWGSIGSTLNAASPPLPIACSPAAFTPGITTSGALSPEVPYTPNHHSTPHPHPIPSFVPESATPGKTATASISAETPSQIQVETMPNTPAPTTSITHHDSLMTSPKFIPESLVIIYPTSDAKTDSASLSDETELVPQQWQAMQMDFKAVWGDRGTRYGTVYKYVLADTANDQTPSHLEGSTRRKRALNEIHNSPESPMRKHARFEKDESDSDDDSDSSESDDEDEIMKGPNDEDEEVLEDGEVMAGGGGSGHATAAAAAASSVAASFSVDRESELKTALALQLMVEGMTVGRGSTCFSDGIVRTHGNSVETSVLTRRKENSLKPVFAHRILQFLSSTLSQVFAGSALGATDSVSIRGPLTLEQVFDYNDTIDPKTPKYGKFQLRKKKRIDPILELLPLPHLRAEHNDIPISLNPTALRVWDKLGLSPAAGTKDVEYLILAPAGTRSFVSHLRRWTTELSNLWDFSNFGSMSPCLQLQGKFSDEDGVVQAKLRQVKSDTRDDSRMRAYAETMDALAPELARIVYYHTKSTNAPYTALFLLNPLPHKPQSSSELHLIVSRLLVNVSDMTKIPLQTILEYIIPVVLPIQFAVMPRMTEAPCLLNLKEFIFGLYSRCRGRSRPDTDEAVSLGFAAHACFVSKSLPSPGVGLMMRRPLDAPTCTVSDPDRIIHAVYKMGASSSSSAGVCWSDSYGELVDCAVVAVDKSASRWFLKFLAEVWERTVTLLRLRKIAAGVTWRLVIAREGLLSNLELHDFETFSSYISTVNSSDIAVQSVTSLSFVSLNTDSSLTVIDPGAVNGIPGGGASQYFLAGNLIDPVTDKKVGAHAELDQIRKKVNSHERIIPDDDASYIFLMRSQRLPISKMTEVSDPSCPARAEKDSQKPDSFLPLANGYLVNVPRRESNLPSEAASTMSSVPLPPPEGSPASQTVEISLLHHVNMPTQPKATCYPGWLPISPASKTENVGQYSSPAASISTPTSSFSVVSNTNTPVLAHTHIEKSPGTINPTTPQPSTPFSGGIGGGGGGGGGGSGVLVGAPQQHHVNILRDIMREYHGLKYAHRGPSIQGVVGEAGARVVPWMFEMAEISERVGDEFHRSV